MRLSGFFFTSNSAGKNAARGKIRERHVLSGILSLLDAGKST
jgi:hypothetical protein